MLYLMRIFFLVLFFSNSILYTLIFFAPDDICQILLIQFTQQSYCLTELLFDLIQVNKKMTLDVGISACKSVMGNDLLTKLSCTDLNSIGQ